MYHYFIVLYVDLIVAPAVLLCTFKIIDYSHYMYVHLQLLAKDHCVAFYLLLATLQVVTV